MSVINTTPRPIKVRQVDWAVVQNPIPLENLMWTELERSLEWQPLLKDAVLEGGNEEAPGYLRMPVPFAFEPGDARHLVFRVWAEDPKDPKNMNRGLGQASLSALSEQAR